MPKSSLLKNSRAINLPIAGVHTFPKDNSSKVNVIAQLEFEHPTMSQSSTLTTMPLVSEILFFIILWGIQFAM